MHAVDINALLTEDRKEWDALLPVLDTRPTGTVHGNGKNAWDSRDVYAHIAHWLRYSNDNLAKAREGQPVRLVDESQIEDINHKWQQKDSQLTLQAARQWALTEFARRIELIKSMPDIFWDHDNLRLVSFDGASHFRDHRHYITG